MPRAHQRPEWPFSLSGAVINPDVYLPYSVATITLLAHTHATYNRLVTVHGSYSTLLM